MKGHGILLNTCMRSFVNAPKAVIKAKTMSEELLEVNILLSVLMCYYVINRTKVRYKRGKGNFTIVESLNSREDL